MKRSCLIVVIACIFLTTIIKPGFAQIAAVSPERRHVITSETFSDAQAVTETKAPETNADDQPAQHDESLQPMKKSDAIGPAAYQSKSPPLYGYDVFSGFAGNPSSEIPLRPDYIVGTGDIFECFVWGRDGGSFTMEINVEGEGIIPQIGAIKLAGLTYANMKIALRDALSKRLSDFQLSVVPLKKRQIRVYVLGEASRPGAYDVTGDATIHSVLFTAGGPSVHGSMRHIRHKRGDHVIATIDLYEFLLHGNRETDMPLQEGDVIHIPLAGCRVTVQGLIRRPAVYEMKNGDRLLSEIIKMAGNPLPGSDIEKIRIERTLPHDKRIVFNANLSGRPVDGSESVVSCCDQDIITIYSISPRNQEQVILEGHVFEPGARPWQKGMKLSDIITDSGVLKRDACLDYAEIKREVGPGGYIEMLTFNPDKVLKRDYESDLLLHARDRIRILSCQEIHETPTVRITGEVMKPGNYDLITGMTVRDLVYRAGGLKLQADLSRCDLSRNELKQGRQVTKLSQIDLESALEDKAGANPILKAGDVVAVRSTPDWQRNSNIEISGEVLYPGEYSFQPGERISDVIRRAGGYTPRAYLPAAYFRRVSTLELQKQNVDLILRNARLEQHIEAIKAASRLNEDREDGQLVDEEQIRMLQNLSSREPSGRLVVKLENCATFAGSLHDLVLEPGDRLHIPAQPSIVSVEGAVGNPTVISWVPDKNMLYYIEQAGGISRYGQRDNAKLIRADGSTLAPTRRHRPAHSFLGTRVQPGDTIWIPVDMRPRRQSRWKTTKDLTQILSNLAITYIAVDNASR